MSDRGGELLREHGQHLLGMLALRCGHRTREQVGEFLLGDLAVRRRYALVDYLFVVEVAFVLGVAVR